MLNVTLQTISMVLCLVGFIQVRVVPKHAHAYYRHYIGFFAVLFVYSACVLTALLLSGREGGGVHIVLSVFVFFEFIAGYMLTFQVANMMLSRVNTKDNHRAVKLYRTVLCVFFGVQILALAVSQFTSFYYAIDSANVFQRRDGYVVHIILWVSAYFYAVYLLIRFRYSMKLKSFVSFVLFASLFGTAFILQILFPSVYFLTAASSFSIVVLFTFVAADNSEEYYRIEREIEKLKVDIMISQIQPHYLFNSLTTIKYLCRHDPAAAEKAVADFSVFLRGNMDSINSDSPIPFPRELAHTEAYLALERLRFGDNLAIVYDIGCTGFFLPALTLQPIVENAVRHGIRETPDGCGTVTIATRELDDRYEITVTDDGCGFDAENAADPSGKHLGIDNVRYRLTNMCGGTLAVRSEKGKGTQAVITLAKDE